MIKEEDIKNDVYYLIIQEGKDIKPIKELSSEHIEKFEEAKKSLGDLRYYKRRVKEIELNHSDYIDNSKKIENKLITTPLEDLKEFDKYFIDINRRFINFITSLKSFVDTLENRMKSRYGENSKEFESLKKNLSNYYGTYFSYRFFYHLRNFSVHVDYPINNIMMDYEYNPDRSIRSGKLNINFVKSHLLANTKLNSKFNYELASFAEKFPVEPQMIEILKPISKLLKKIVNTEQIFFRNAVEIYEKYMKLVSTEGEYGYGKRIQISQNICKWESKYFPKDLIDEFNSLSSCVTSPNN